MSLFKKVGHALKSVAGIAAPIVGGAIGGPLGAKVGAAVGGALTSSHGAKKAGKASSAGYNAAAQESRNALIGYQQDQQPYLGLGAPAANALTAVNSGDYSGFMNSPDYLYARDQELQGVDNSAAARGGLFSGNTGRRLAEVAGGLASQNLGNYRNALMQQIGVGQNAANNLGNARLQVAGNVGNALVGAGDARATGIADSANSWADALGTATGALTDAGVFTKKKKIKLNKLISAPNSGQAVA